MQALEYSKEFLRELLVEPHTIIFDMIRDMPGFASAAKFNHSRFPVTSEFNGVGEKINQDMAYQRLITPRQREHSHFQLRCAVRTSSGKLLENRLAKRGHVQHAGLHLLASQPRKVEQFVNQESHPLGFILN